MLQADRLREIREKQGWSQRDLSRACGIADNMIYRYENQLADPSSSALTVIANKLGVSADYLLGLSNDSSGKLTDTTLDEDEIGIVNIYRREGWVGVIRLGAERLSK